MSYSVLVQAHWAEIGQNQGIPALPTSIKLQQIKPISKLYRQLLRNNLLQLASGIVHFLYILR